MRNVIALTMVIASSIFALTLFFDYSHSRRMNDGDVPPQTNRLVKIAGEDQRNGNRLGASLANQNDGTHSTAAEREKSVESNKATNWDSFDQNPPNVWFAQSDGTRYMIKEGWLGRRYKHIEIPADESGGYGEKKEYRVKEIIPYEGKLFEFTCHPYNNTPDLMGTVEYAPNEMFIGFVKDSKRPEEIVEKVFLFENIRAHINPSGNWEWSSDRTKLLAATFQHVNGKDLVPFIKDRMIKASSDSERRMAMRWILDIGEIDEILDEVTRFVVEEYDTSALHVLIESKRPWAIPALIKFVERKDAHKDFSEELQTRFAIKALAQVGGDEHTPFIVEEMQKMQRVTEGDAMRSLAYEKEYRDILAKLGHQESVNWLIDCLNDPTKASWGIIGLANANASGLITHIVAIMSESYLETDPSSIRTALWTLLEKLDKEDRNELMENLAPFLKVNRETIKKDIAALGNAGPDGIESIVNQLWEKRIIEEIGVISASDQEMRQAVRHVGIWLNGKLSKYQKQ
ncbi:MAG: hypothetical protein A2Z34_04365 [Planctomycetes bacterium RBG_16_59_8]|nr:MAG: hypothetical protein A2Z34_04365 [Planctomycetes bacterium RBG_16_59_8]